MKKIDFTNPGGLELFINDVQYIYNSLREGLLGSCSWMKQITDPVIISGIVVTEGGGLYSHTEGWIYYNSDLYYVAAVAGQPLAGGTNYIVEFASKNLPGGLRLCEDNSPAEVWVEDFARIKRGSAGTLLNDCLRYNEALITALTEGAWITIGSGGGAPAYSTGWFGTLKFKLNRFGELEFFGNAENLNLNVGNEQVAILPVGYRPSIDMELVVSGKEAGNPAVMLIRVLTNGSIQLAVPSYGTAKNMYLNPVRLRLAP